MRVGVTGHQMREGIDWAWVRTCLSSTLMGLDAPESALTCLAVGSDQVFAEVALSLKIRVVAVIPMKDYAKFFAGPALTHYVDLLSASTVHVLEGASSEEESFLVAGKFVVDNCDTLFAVWDGQPSKGIGGTADIVDYARTQKKLVIRIDPIGQKVERL